jgi:NhaP-type Na+/H+ or K+/H+ antiporter
MEHEGLVAILVCVLAAAAISKRIEGTILTLPMLYTGFGLLLGARGLGLIEAELENELINLIAEVTLILVLASDASRIDLARLAKDHTLPLRLLSISLPLMMVFGTVVAAAVFAGLSFWEAAVLAVILSPTDASLGQSVVSSPRVPVRIQQTLNVESGLNDGIAMPFLLLAIAMAAATEAASAGPSYWIPLALGEIVWGAGAGVIIGYLGVKFLEIGHEREWMSEEFEKISTVVLALLAYAVAGLIGGNGFIAAFCFGATSGNVGKTERTHIMYTYVETEVQVLMLLTFTMYGAVMLPLALDTANGTIALYAVVSLILLRTLAVAFSFVGTRVRPVTTAFVGWFGPRGVASMLYIFIVLESEGIASADLIYDVVMITVLFSIVTHGVTAAPAASWYGKRLADESVVRADAPEKAAVSEIPLRGKSRI